MVDEGLCETFLFIFSMHIQVGGFTHHINKSSEFTLTHSTFKGEADQLFPKHTVSEFWDIEFSHSFYHHPAQPLCLWENALQGDFLLLLLFPHQEGKFILLLKEVLKLLVKPLLCPF